MADARPPTPRPVVFLDVDGVVSADSSKHGFGDGRRVIVDGFRLTLSVGLAARLRNLEADIRWLTTWGETANDVGRAVGLPRYDVAALPPEGTTASGPWKFKAVQAQVKAEHRPFVWLDDDAIPLAADAWAADCGVPSLLIRPKADRGLTPADLDRVEAFLATVGGSA